MTLLLFRGFPFRHLNFLFPACTHAVIRVAFVFYSCSIGFGDVSSIVSAGFFSWVLVLPAVVFFRPVSVYTLFYTLAWCLLFLLFPYYDGFSSLKYGVLPLDDILETTCSLPSLQILLNDSSRITLYLNTYRACLHFFVISLFGIVHIFGFSCFCMDGLSLLVRLTSRAHIWLIRCFLRGELS